jgi:hypothetical protein
MTREGSAGVKQWTARPKMPARAPDAQDLEVCEERKKSEVSLTEAMDS